MWIHSGNDFIEVKAGRELHELAEGKLSFDEIRELRVFEVPVGR